MFFRPTEVFFQSECAILLVSILGGFPLPWLFLAGELAPIGYTISFLQRPAGDVLEIINDIRANATLEVTKVGHLPGSASVLDPMEAPWTTELVIECGEWTAYLNNSIGGGDITAIAPAVGRILNTVCVGAEHTDRYGPGQLRRSYGSRDQMASHR